MHTCPECLGEIEEQDDYFECLDCGARFDLDSTDEEYEELDEDFY